MYKGIHPLVFRVNDNPKDRKPPLYSVIGKEGLSIGVPRDTMKATQQQ